MRKQSFLVFPEQMKALARYEETFRQFGWSADHDNVQLIFPERYQMTLEDLYTAINNLLAKNPTVGEMWDYWLLPLSLFDEPFGISKACGDHEDNLFDIFEDGDEADDLDEIDEETRNEVLSFLKNLDKKYNASRERDARPYQEGAYRGFFRGDEYADPDEEEEDWDWIPTGEGDPNFALGLPQREEDEFLSVWVDLGDLCDFEDDETHAADLNRINEFLTDIVVFLSNRDKPILERQYTDHQKKEFIRFFNNDYRMKSASDLEIELCRRFTDELCEKGSRTALHLKGYSCYGGNRLYPCDWKTSRDCMLHLFEETDDPQYANTLGYIYYYGRCTNGVPEYDKAFEMFTISAANGLHEGLYKLADMFRNGYGCRKSPGTARSLYGMVYEDCYYRYPDEEDGSFADAALRMGNVFFEGIGEDIDLDRAYSFYLQADFAARRRAEHSNFFGDTTVAVNARKALEKTRELLPKEYFLDCLSLAEPPVFQLLVQDGYRAEVSYRILRDGTAEVTVERLPKKNEPVAPPVLLTCPEISYCDLITGMKMKAIGLQVWFNPALGTPVMYETCEWNDEKDRIDFFYDDDLVGWMACDEYRITKPEGE